MKGLPPKIIHALWLQGVSQAPDWVRRNFDRAQALNPDYEVMIHDRKSVFKLLNDFEITVPDNVTNQALYGILLMSMLMGKTFGFWTA